MIETLWDLMGTPYYLFIVVKEPELIEQWREYHKVTEDTRLKGVYPSTYDPGAAFHVLKSHVPYKRKNMSTLYFGMHNGLNRTGPHQYFPLEDYDTLIEVHDEPISFQKTDENGNPVFDKDKQPVYEEFHPIRNVSLSTEWLKDFTESRSDHKVQKEPKEKWEALFKYIPYIAAIAGLYLFATQILPTLMQ